MFKFLCICKVFSCKSAYINLGDCSGAIFCWICFWQSRNLNTYYLIQYLCGYHKLPIIFFRNYCGCNICCWSNAIVAASNRTNKLRGDLLYGAFILDFLGLILKKSLTLKLMSPRKGKNKAVAQAPKVTTSTRHTFFAYLSRINFGFWFNFFALKWNRK